MGAHDEEVSRPRAGALEDLGHDPGLVHAEPHGNVGRERRPRLEAGLQAAADLGIENGPGRVRGRPRRAGKQRLVNVRQLDLCLVVTGQRRGVGEGSGCDLGQVGGTENVADFRHGRLLSTLQSRPGRSRREWIRRLRPPTRKEAACR